MAITITLSLAGLAIVVVAAVDRSAEAKLPPAVVASAEPEPEIEPIPARAPTADSVAETDAEFEGRVREVLLAGSYAYFEVELASGEVRWVVTMDAPPTRGDQVRVEAFGERRNFHSRRLAREFERVLFGEYDPA